VAELFTFLRLPTEIKMAFCSQLNKAGAIIIGRGGDETPIKCLPEETTQLEYIIKDGKLESADT
jgi:hypothetical protein